MRRARFLIAATALFCFGSLAHFVGGGSVASSGQHLAYLLITFLIVSRLLREELGGPGLALAVLIAQFSTHFLFAPTADSESLMLFSHIFFGIISYLFAARTELLIFNLTSTISLFFSKFLISPSILRLEIQPTQFIRIQSDNPPLQFFVSTGVQLRAPPVK